MSKREDQLIAKLVKKNTAITRPATKDRAAPYDSTLRQRPEEQSDESKQFFKEMKRREF
jgi:hypothetical protein